MQAEAMPISVSSQCLETEHNLMTSEQIASICLSHSKALSVTEVAKVRWPARPCQGLV